MQPERLPTLRILNRPIMSTLASPSTGEDTIPMAEQKPIDTQSGLPAWSRLVLGLFAIGIAVAAQFQLTAGNAQFSALLYAAALMAMIGAAYNRRGPDVRLAPAAVLRLPIWVWPGLLGALGAIILAVLALARFTPDPPPLSAWTLHLSSLGLFVVSMLWLDSLTVAAASDEETRPWSITERVAMAAILALGVFMRLYRFDELPYGTWYDEAENGLQALRILEQPDFWPLFVGSIHAPAHYLYLIAGSFQILGPTTEAIRAVSVVMGLGAVWSGYLVGRELFGRRLPGLTVAFLIAVSAWTVNFSRIGMYNIATPFFELLTIGFLLRGMRRQRLADYLWAGLSMGLGFSFYSAFQLFLPVVALFVIYTLIVRRGFLRQGWPGLLVMGMMALLVVAPIVQFAYHHPDIYFSRTQDTFLFADKSEDERWPALVESVRKHVLMFNLRGDPNGRHNLPGEPMLDPILGALLVLGLGLSLWRFYRPGSLLLLLWMAVMLLGGILSLDFEAPQSLRAIGTLPAAYLLAAVPIETLWRAWQETATGRRYPRLFVWPLLIALASVAYINYEAYFERRATDFASWNAFSTPESIAAALLREEGDEAEFYIISFFHGHPTLHFLARDHRDYRRLETTDQLPLRRSADRDIVLIMNAESRAIYEQAQRYYANATFREIGAPFGGPTVIYYVRITPQDISALQGLTGVYYEGSDWEGEPAMTRQESTIAFDWQAAPPVEGPFTVEWSGVLSIETYGPYRLILRAPDKAELLLNEEVLLEGSGELATDIVLAKGNHALRIRATGGEGPFEFAWQTPGRAEEIVPAWALYVPPVSNNGLLGRYFANGSWQAPEHFAQIDPELNFYFHIPLLPRPYTVEWIGKIYIAQAGNYRFGLESIDESRLFIDGQEVTASLEPNQLREGSLYLEEGLHDIQVRYADRTAHTHINLYWTPPGRGQSHIPADVLFPPQGGYEYIDTAAAEALFQSLQIPAGAVDLAPSSPLATTRLPVVADVLPVALDRPRAIAVAAGGSRIYVADAQHLLILDGEGKTERRIEGAEAPFQEIADLAVNGEGDLFVLDAGRARVSVFSADGSYRRDVPTEALHSGRSRGLFVDGENRLWLANTPNGQLVSLSAEGTVLQSVPVSPGVETQPVDLLVTAAGDIYATDVALNRLFHLESRFGGGQSWDIPIANSVDGPHLAMDGAGTLYVTMPEQGTVLALPSESAEGIEYVLPQLRDVPPKVVGIAASSDGGNPRIWTVDSDGSAVISFTPAN